MSHSFPPDVEEQIRRQMEQGEYESEAELLRDALAALVARNADIAAIRAGIEDMESGRTSHLKDIAAENPRERS